MKGKDKMVDKSVVELGLNYLDRCIANGERASLSKMLNYIDYYDRLVANLDEVNEILRQRPSICVQRHSGSVELIADSGEHAITEAELNDVITEYGRSFAEELARLNRKH